ncbi:hypothetical protein OH76DRAFT_1366482 [Lentinus brumalis]|uniref:Uncharacterized protein n=1 Tax=Lentinus brumalis TaxID=2498619 RepID=A0A371CJ06_9APHY|nr:hypothetical protein OH76DRAFT_1366482 [Polyporus brumalis]
MAYKSSPPPPYTPLDESTPYSSVFDSFRHSISSLTMAPSKLEVEVLPFDHVDMYGEPDKDAAYSLSGQVAVTLVSSSSWFCDAPPDERFLLESLVLTFEGQSELVTPQTGYASCRVIEFSEELITNGPVEIHHSWDQGSSRDRARWFIVFNLKVPGWLPATCSTTFGDQMREEPEVSYRLSAVAKYRDAKPTPQLSWRSCYGYMTLPTTQVAKTSGVSVKVNRYWLPPPPCLLGDSEFPDSPFRSAEYAGSITDGCSRIPLEILSKLRMRACVPEHIALDAGAFPLLLKIRPDGLSVDERKRLRLNGFFVAASQRELLRSAMSKKYATQWPVPAASDQPPNRPLRPRRNDIREYECGLLFTPPPGTTAQATHSLLPSGFSGRIELDGAGVAKASFDDECFDDEETWVRIRVDIPFRDLLIDPRYLHQYAEHAAPKLRPTELGPILSVVHSLDIALTCTYDMPDDESDGSVPNRVLDELKLTIPLSFVRVPRSGPNQPVAESFTADCESPLSRSGPAGSVRLRPELIQPRQPYVQTLPAYNQLYHKNGNRKEDPTPLPLYAPKGQTAPEHPLRPFPTLCKQTPLHKADVFSTPPSSLPRS